MSGPFGVNITVISGQKSSGEIVVAAATFLSMNYLTISVVANDGKTRQEFLKALEVFGKREHLYYQAQPDIFAQRLVKPSNSLSTKCLFWLALDNEGEFLAKSIFEANGEVPDKRVYRSVHKLNLIEQTITPPPQAPILLRAWEEAKRQANRLSIDYHRLKVKESRQAYVNSHAPLPPEQKNYWAWCESLYESLIPWQDTIKNIQSDYS